MTAYQLEDIPFSVIIPTYNRNDALKECLESIFIQTKCAFELIIVDNAHSESTRLLVSENKKKFLNRNINVIYIPNTSINSLTVARNIGVRKARGKIVFFIDDDVEIESNYFEEILKTYKKSDAIGVQGYLKREHYGKTRNLILKFFFGFNLQLNKSKIYASVSGVYPKPLEKVINCQHFSGSNHSFKMKVFNNIQYDEKLIKYSEGEDVDFSYRVNLLFPNKMFITPFAKAIHRESSSGRIIGQELIYMREVYGYYLYKKLFTNNLTNKFIYFWSRLGKVVIYFFLFIKNMRYIHLKELKTLIKAYFYTFNNRKNFGKGNLEKFNNSIK